MSLIEGFEHIVRENEPLAPYTSMRLGGPAEFFAEPTTYDELADLIKRFRSADLPIKLLGGGSNVLVRDEGTPGLVIRLNAPVFCDLSVEGSTLQAGGGAQLNHLISTAVREGFSGPEHLVGIPGTVGGALHHNSGSHGGAIGQWVQSVEVMTRSGERKTRVGNDLAFGYRKSSLNELAILSATFAFEREDSETLTRRMQKMWIIRKSKQPTYSCNPGFVFKDPVGLTASELIEQSGLKGTSVGRVEVSDGDPNYFVAHQDATCDDVLRLIDLVKSQVHERMNAELEVGIDLW